MAVHLPPGADARRDLVCYSAPNIDPDPLTHVLRSGARRLLAEAIEAEVEAFGASLAELVLSQKGNPGKLGVEHILAISVT